MGPAEYIKFFAALLFVVGLMGGLALILKRLGLQGKITTGGKGRLKLVEVLPLDARRRAALIQRDDVQHLIILGASGETVVETNIESANNANEKN